MPMTYLFNFVPSELSLLRVAVMISGMIGYGVLWISPVIATDTTYSPKEETNKNALGNLGAT